MKDTNTVLSELIEAGERWLRTSDRYEDPAVELYLALCMLRLEQLARK